MTRVYVAGPMTTGDLVTNVTDAINVAENLWQKGFVPFVPHLMCFYQLQHWHSYEEWLEYDFKWLSQCDALYRMPGVSPGADKEMVYAKEQGIPVYTDMDKLVKAYSNGRSA